MAECEISVDPAWRRQGVGRELLAAVLEIADSDQRTSLIAWGPTTDACFAFWTSAGLVHRYTERVARADLHQTDAVLMRRWTEQATRRARGLEPVFWRGACPEVYQERLAEVETGLSDAPINELELDDYAYDATHIAERDQMWLERGTEPWVILALDPETDAAAGVTEVLANGHDRSRAEQWTTVVLPGRRGHGLARLLKTTMYERLRADAPELRFLDTWKADSNRTMLLINEEMGFRRFREYAAWQGQTATARHNLRAMQRA